MGGGRVYFGGKPAGGLAFRIGEFSKEPSAGVTPIKEMLEIDALDRRPGLAPEPADRPAANSPNQSGTTQTASPGENTALPVPNYGNYLKPIDTPLVFNGFSNETLQRYAPQFAAAGIVSVMGIGPPSARRHPEPNQPRTSGNARPVPVRCGAGA